MINVSIDEQALQALIDARVRLVVQQMFAGLFGAQLPLPVSLPHPHTNGATNGALNGHTNGAAHVEAEEEEEPAPVQKAKGKPGPKPGSKRGRKKAEPTPTDSLFARGQQIADMERSVEKMYKSTEFMIEVFRAQPDCRLRGLGAGAKMGWPQSYFRWIASKLIEAKVIKVQGTKQNTVYIMNDTAAEKWLAANEPDENAQQDVTHVELVADA